MPFDAQLKWTATGEIFEKASAEVIRQASLFYMDLAVETISNSVQDRVTVDTGAGRRSIITDSFPITGAVVGVVTSNQPHVHIHDQGAKFKKMPKDEPLDLWTRRQRIVGPLKARSRKKGKPGPKVKLKGKERKDYEIKRASFAIRRKIKADGLPAQNFFDKGLMDVQIQVDDLLKRRLPENVAKSLGGS